MQAVAQNFQLYHTFAGHTAEISCVEFSPNAKFLLTSSRNGELFIWDVKAKKLLNKVFAHAGYYVTEITFSPNGEQVVTAGYDGTVKIWKFPELNLVQTFSSAPVEGISYTSLKGNEPCFAAFSPDGQYVYYGGYNRKLYKGTIANGEIKQLLHTVYPLTCGKMSYDKKYLLFNTATLLNLLDYSNDKIVRTIEINVKGDTNKDFICEMNSSANGKQLGLWLQGGQAALLNTQTWAIEKVMAQVNVEGSSEIVFTPDGKYLLSRDQSNRAILWSLENGKQLEKLTGHTADVNVVDVSPDGKFLSTGSNDKLVKLWEIKITKDTEREAKSPTETITASTETEKIEFEGKEVKIDEKIVLKNIQFEQSKYNILPASNEELNKLVAFLQKYKTIEIELAGHTDNVGNQMLNYKLSEQRVVAVKNFLMNKGIESTRIRTVAYGGTQPLADNNNEEGRKKNRRVEMKVVKIK